MVSGPWGVVPVLPAGVGHSMGGARRRRMRLSRMAAPENADGSPVSVVTERTTELIAHTASLRKNMESLRSLRSAQRNGKGASRKATGPAGQGASRGTDREVSRLMESISEQGGALEPMVSSSTAEVLREALVGEKGQGDLNKAVAWLRGKEEAEQADAQRLREVSKRLSDAFEEERLLSGGIFDVQPVKALVEEQREAQDSLMESQADVQMAIAACARLAADGAAQMAEGEDGSLQLIAAAEMAAEALLVQERELLENQCELRARDEALARAESNAIAGREATEQVRELVAKQRSQLSTATNLLSEVQAALQTTTGELKAGKAEVERVKAELRAREAEFEKGKQQLKARTDLLESTLDTLEFRDDEMLELKKIRDRVMEEGSKLKVRNAALEEALAAMHSQLLKVREENQFLADQAAEAEERAAKAQALAQEKDVLVKSLQKTLAAAKSEIRKLVEMRDSRRNEVEAVALEVSSLKHMGAEIAVDWEGKVDPEKVKEVASRAAKEVAEVLARRENELRRARELISKESDSLASQAVLSTPEDSALAEGGSLLEQVRASQEASRQLAAVKQRQLDDMRARISLIRSEREAEQKEISALRTELAATKETLKQKDLLQAYPFVPDDRGRLVMSLADVNKQTSGLKELLSVSEANPSRLSPREQEELEAATMDALADEHSEKALFAHIDAVVAGGAGAPLGMRFNSTAMDTLASATGGATMSAHIAAILADNDGDGDAAAALAGAG